MMDYVNRARRKVKRILRNVGILPATKPVPKANVRKDVTIYTIQSGLQLRVYWKVLPIGKGSAVILEAYGHEVVKYDCFGMGEGHYHIAPYGGLRIFFVEQTPTDQIERAHQDLLANGERYLGLSEVPKISTLQVDKASFKETVIAATARMRWFQENIAELQNGA